MNRKMTAIIAGTALAIAAAMPASATVINTNAQYLSIARNHSRRVVVERLTPRPKGIIVARFRRKGRAY